MAEFVISTRLRCLGWAATAVMLAATVAMVAGIFGAFGDQ